MVKHSEDLEWLLEWVQHGYGWCATHFLNRHRKAENATGSNVVVIDFDGDTTLGRFWQTDTARNWCVATYTSSSHSESEHRFRAIFPLEIELSTSRRHRGAYWLIVDRLIAERAIPQLKDNCGQKPERLWFGSTNAQTTVNVDACVPEFLLKDIDYEEFQVQQSDITDLDLRRCKWLLENFLRPSEDGEYETYYVPVLAACAGIGEAVFDDWVDWVLRGHHGEKDENIKPFKWRGLGNYSGHTTVFTAVVLRGLVLYPELGFSLVGSAVGYETTLPLMKLYPI